MANALKLSRHLQQNNFEIPVDYSKFENTNVSSHRKKIIASARDRDATGRRQENVSMPKRPQSSRKYEENVVMPQRPQSSRKYENPADRGIGEARKTRSETKVRGQSPSMVGGSRSSSRQRVGERSASPSKDASTGKRPEKWENNQPTSKQSRSSRSDTNFEARSNSRSNVEARSHSQTKVEARSNSRNEDRVPPLKEVKRRLEFGNDCDDELTAPNLDFTDKIAALRSVIGRDRETKTVQDRRSYYDEYRTSQKRIMVSRTDSLKENSGGDAGVHMETIENGKKSREKSSTRTRARNVQSADMFSKPKILAADGRMSVIDINMLKTNLAERRLKQHTTERKVVAIHFGEDNLDQDIPMVLNIEDSMLHAAKDRKVMSSKKAKIGNAEINEVDLNSRPLSRCDTKETQTDVLNHSVHSVQSNVPFYEPNSPRLHDRIGRREILTEQKKSTQKDRKSVSEENHRRTPVTKEVVKSHGRPSSRGSVTESRQSNINNGIDTHITSDKGMTEGVQKDESDVEFEIRRKKLLAAVGRDWTSNEVERKSHTSTARESVRNDPGNHRPSSRTRDPIRHTAEHRKEHNDINAKNSPRRRSKTIKNDIDADFINKSFKDDDVDRKLDVEYAKRILIRADRTDRKVRDWIISQERDMVPSDTGSVTLVDELSISVGLAAEQHRELLNSPTHSCDKIPVKLEKPQCTSRDSRPSSVNQMVDLPLGRKTISDRLDWISMAALTEQNRLKSEVPVRDKPADGGRKSTCGPVMRSTNGPVMRSTNGPMMKSTYGPVMNLADGPVMESDSADTESSIFSLPFSIESGESVSTTIQAVKLLRRLYNVDEETRQNLVLLAKCFRRWLNNVLHAKRRNQEITQAAMRVSPISYGVMLRKGEICYRTSTITRYFEQWKSAVRCSRLLRTVALLQRKHMLRKGMNAFKWAINRSKLQQGILQDRINSMLLNANFNKWRERAIENRRLRLQQAFLRWRQFTKEAQKMRALRTQMNLRLKQRIYLEWRDKFKTRLKQNKADRHFRLVLMSYGWLSWKQYTMVSKEKKRRHALARQLYVGVLQRKMFCCMKVEFVKYTRAKQFHRVTQLKVALLAWQTGTRVSQTERQEDVQVAVAYRTHTTVRTHFTTWRDGLLTRRACRMSDQVITRHAFTLWSTRYQQLVRQRAAVDAYKRHKVLSTTFRRWSGFVARMKRRRAAAVECIHSVLERHVLRSWRGYTMYQKGLRKRHQMFQVKLRLERQRQCLTVWRSQFKVKVDTQRAQQLWSNSCAKKAAERWRSICHKRCLIRLVEDTEPLRQLATQRVFFMKWRSRLQLVEDEKCEAAEVRAQLDLSQLRERFTTWLVATQQLLLIKPMVLRYQRTLMAQCFTGWHAYVQHKAECSQSQQKFVLVQLKHRFAAWRRQYEIHQIEKDINKRRVENQARHCLKAWQHVIRRKHAARDFHKRHVMQQAFYHWNTCALRQLRQRMMEKMEMETVMSTLREYFDRWRQCLYLQQTQAEQGVVLIQQTQEHNRVKVMFNFWRRHFRATLVARENEKIRIRRLARQAIQEWHRCTQNSLQEAVERFAVAIGLREKHADRSLDVQDIPPEADQDDEYFERLDSFEPMNFDTDLGSHSSPLTPRTPRTPKQGSSYGTPFRRMFSPSLSRQSLVQSLDFEAGPIISSSFLDARFEMEHAVKTESRREIVVTMVTRLRHWPVSIVFEQWKEYTSRQRQLKSLTDQMVQVQQKLVLTQYFNSWVKHFRAMELAKQHYDQVLQHKALLSLILYRNSRKHKKQQSLLANLHYARTVYVKVFPQWLVKAQEKQHTERIVHLWTTITAEEQQLIPRERSFRYKLNRQSLTTCFQTWLVKYRRLHAIKRAYHRILLDKYMKAWSCWALERHERRVRAEQFRERRVQTLVLRTWVLRYTQRTEVARRYEDTWHNYMGVILQTWSRWAKDQRKCRMLSARVTETRCSHVMMTMFSTWKAATQKQIEVKKWYQKRLAIRTLYAWQEVAAWQKDLRERQLKCQFMSCTVLAQRAWHQWRTCYLARQEKHEIHVRIVGARVHRIAMHWRRQAQTTRGEILHRQLQEQKVGHYFCKWRAAYGRHLERVDRLTEHLTTKHHGVMVQALNTWRTELLCRQAQRVFNMKLLVTILHNWRIATQACKQRSASLAQYRANHERHAQRGYFLYWYNVARARKSIRGHANLKMQLTVFKSWLVHTRKMNNLRRLETAFTRRRHQRIVQNHWYLLKTRYHYCAELAHTASGVVMEKNRYLMRQALAHWEFRLKIVIADEFYRHILAKRVAGRWHQFVERRRKERQRMKELTRKAIRFYRRTLCNKVYVGWYNEILVSRQVRRHKARLCVKYALIWKHKVDLAYTGRCFREECLYKRAWRLWHLQYVQRKTVVRMEAFDRRHLLTMVFTSWRALCRKRSRRLSQIPLPVSPAFNMPYPGTNSSVTPSDDLVSSLPPNRPTQIPLHSSSRNKGRQLPATGRVTPTGPNGRTTPTSLSKRNSSVS